MSLKYNWHVTFVDADEIYRQREVEAYDIIQAHNTGKKIAPEGTEIVSVLRLNPIPEDQPMFA